MYMIIYYHARNCKYIQIGFKNYKQQAPLTSLCNMIPRGIKADRHGATLPRNYCMQPCYATYAMSNHDGKRLHGKCCTTRLRGEVAPCLSALGGRQVIVALAVSLGNLSPVEGTSPRRSNLTLGYPSKRGGYPHGG